MKEKVFIRYIDFILNSSEEGVIFNLNEILKKDKTLNSRDDNFTRLVERLKESMLSRKYIEPERIQRINIYKLAKEGLLAKEKGGHIKYQRFLNRKPMSKFEIIYLILIFITISVNIIQWYQNNSLKTDFDSLKSERNSLKLLSVYNDFKIDSLTNNLILYKAKSLNDTLQAKNLTN